MLMTPATFVSQALQQCACAACAVGVVQTSFGHALGNTMLPLFLMLGNHFSAEDIPSHLQVMFATNQRQSDTMLAVAKATISHNIHLLPVWLSSQQNRGLTGVCFR
jgi:hypothetical protein